MVSRFKEHDIYGLPTFVQFLTELINIKMIPQKCWEIQEKVHAHINVSSFNVYTNTRLNIM